MTQEDYELELRGDGDEQQALMDGDKNSEGEREVNLYAKAIDACGFGFFHVMIMAVSGWALASDSIEMQVLSFVLPSACDLKMTSHQKGWLNSILFVGMMVGGYLFGGAADVKGRRYVLLWSMSINGIFGLASAFAPDFTWFLVLRFLSGIGVGAAMPIIFSYCAEFMSTNRRGPVIGCLASFWLVGNLLTCMFAWLIIPHVELGKPLSYIFFSSWRIFIVVGALPSLTSTVFMYLMPESPMYLQKVGKYDEAYAVFIQMFKLNYGDKISLPPEIKGFSDYYKSSDNEEEKIMQDNSELCTFGRRILSVIKTFVDVVKSTKQLFMKPFWCTTLMLIIIWFSLSFGYYGLWMWLPDIFKRIESGHGSGCTNAGAVVPQNITSNLTCQEITARQRKTYIESLAVAISMIPGNLLTILLVNKVGRRPLMAVSMILAGVSVFFFPLVTTRVGMIALLCIFSGMAVGGWNVLDMLAIENYPTDLRSTAFGVQSVFGRIAAICGNIAFGALVDEHCAVPIILVAVLLALGGLISLKLPKTDHLQLT